MMNPSRDELRQQLRELLKAKKEARIAFRDNVPVNARQLHAAQTKYKMECKELSDLGYTIVSV